MYCEIQWNDQVVVCCVKETVFQEIDVEDWQPYRLCDTSDSAFQAYGIGPQGLSWLWLLGNLLEHGSSIQAGITGLAVRH